MAVLPLASGPSPPPGSSDRPREGVTPRHLMPARPTDRSCRVRCSATTGWTSSSGDGSASGPSEHGRAWSSRERGWWDVAVDPRRYRLTSPPWLVRALGFWLIQPDLVLLLEAPPDTILRRKSEISKEEIERQASAWDSVLPARVPVVRVDASRPAAEVAEEAREHVLRMLERRAVSRLGAGWSTIPSRSAARWIIPRGPKSDRRGRPEDLPSGHHERAARLGDSPLGAAVGAPPIPPEDRTASAIGPRDACPAHPEARHARGGQGES